MKIKLNKLSMTIALAAILILTMAACSKSNNSDNNTPTTSPTNQSQEQQPEVTLNPDEPAWKLDTSPVDLTWFVGANWYPHSWGESLASQYVTEKTGVNVTIEVPSGEDRKSTRLNSSHVKISYAVFCLKK